MNYEKTAIPLALAAFAAFSPVVSLAGSGQDTGPVCTCQKAPRYSYENGGCMLLVPKAYDNLLVTEIIKDQKDGKLFSVSEKASIEAAKKLSYDPRGAGWLFGIGRVDEGRRRELLCGDMSGAEIFARDAVGRTYVFYHPTDVRYMRENTEAMKRDQKQWSMLNEWAWTSVREDFCRENGFTAITYDNSAVGMAIARAVYQPDTSYTISTTQYGPIEAKSFDAIPYAERLIQNASYERTDCEAPDGEYVVLAFPDEGTRFDFFKAEGKENYVREVRQDGMELLYKATFSDDKEKASAVMQAWYDALTAQRHN